MKNEEVEWYCEHWAKCPFCGKYNSQYGYPLEQHSARCYYKSNANSREMIVPNHFQFIKEDDKIFLLMLLANNDLPIKLKQLDRANMLITSLKDIIHNFHHEFKKLPQKYSSLIESLTKEFKEKEESEKNLNE